MLKKLLHNLSAERTDINNPSISIFLSQHMKVYNFCKKFVAEKTVLEIGCGAGVGTKELASGVKQILAFDKDEFSIKKSQEAGLKNIEFTCSRIEDFREVNKFDVVISLQVIEHLQDPKILLNKAVSAMKKDGIFILSTPNAYTSAISENPYHYKEYTSKQLQTFLRGFFKKVDLYGLQGDSSVKKYHQLRTKQINSFLKLDVLNFRRIIPRQIRQILFDFSSLITRLLTNSQNESFLSFSNKNYTITQKNIKQSLDLIAICHGKLV